MFVIRSAVVLPKLSEETSWLPPKTPIPTDGAADPVVLDVNGPWAVFPTSPAKFFADGKV